MSVRIYQLSKEINMENQELIQLLRERGYDVKSPSNSIDNISAESLREEFANRAEEPVADASEKPLEESAGDDTSDERKLPSAPADGPSAAPRPRRPNLPPGAVVRSKADVERERQERIEAQRKPIASAPPPPPPRPIPGKLGAGVVAPPPASRDPGAAPRTPTVKAPGGPQEPRRKGTPSEESGSTTQPSSPPTPPKLPPSAPAPVSPPRVPQVPSRTPTTPVIGAPTASREDETATEDTTASPSTEVAAPQVIQVKPPIVVRDFARMIGRRPFQLISELMELNIFASMNQVIEEDVASKIAMKHGFVLEIRHRGEGQQPAAKAKVEVEVDESKLLEPRPPVVCILGHVDHGKTTLLDTIRSTRVVDNEAGGITQHIGAYQVERNGHRITFIDTPGHAAFSRMRARGAEVTDIAILVVAADDGFMPQTDEALGHARKNNVPIVVAINKVDSKGANIDRVKQQMQERDIAPEDWGGTTLCTPVSALKNEGIDDLLDSILLQAEIMELKANPKAGAEGVIIEAQIETGLGPTASIIVQRGTLRSGDALICGRYYCRVRSLIGDSGRAIKSAPPSTPVKVVGWNEAPEAGERFQVVKNEREAKRLADENEHAMKLLRFSPPADADRPPATIEDLFAAIERTQTKVFSVVVKADVFGAAEALAAALEQIKSTKINLRVIDVGVGAVSRNDILMASTSQANIVAFNVGLENGVAAFAKHHGITIHQHKIIYELLDAIREAMIEELDPELRENKLGAAEVRQIFPIAKGKIAGCLVTEGRIQRDARARLLRKGEVIAEGSVTALKRFKDDATEVRAGYECGINLGSITQFEPGDMIECFEIKKFKSAL